MMANDSTGSADKKADKTGQPRKLRVTQVRSKIGGIQEHRDTLRSLGLKRIGDVVVKEDRPEFRGMVKAVRHLVTVEEVD
jgi:large subunit ribosomal protein L30